MDGHGLNQPLFGIVDPIHDTHPDAFRAPPYRDDGRFPGSELAFSPCEFDLDLMDDSSTPTRHSGLLPTNYHAATAGYATFGLGTFQCCAGTAGGLVQSPTRLDLMACPIAYHHPRGSGCSFSSTNAPDNGSDNASPSEDSYHDIVVPYNSVSSTPVSTPPSYFTTADPHSELPNPYLPQAPEEQPGSLAPGTDHIPSPSSAKSFITETSAQPENNAATFASALPGETVPIPIAASIPRLRKLKHRKSLQKSTSEAPSTNIASNAGPSTGTGTGLTPGLLRARIKHKRVERQYRNRLSAQFERLLSVLPADRFHNSDDGDAAYDGESGECSLSADLSARIDGRTVTRAEVLDVAARFIEELELR